MYGLQLLGHYHLSEYGLPVERPNIYREKIVLNNDIDGPDARLNGSILFGREKE